ncbi:MAG: hypothetical protein IT315_11870 [Anaerolineales bacterium]|nr:hypothetical protein [Anaerolineales bacterium]
MPFQDKITHAANVAKWKADQQMRLFKSQSRISEIESQIRTEKSALADKTLILYAQKQLAEDDLKRICANIAVLHGQIIEQQRLQEAAKKEQPPEQQEYSASYPLEQQAHPENYQSEQPMQTDTMPVNVSKKDKVNMKNSSADGKKKQSPLALGGGAILGTIIGCILSLIALSILLN